MAKKEETFLLVSLEESKAKRLAQVINNDTCRRILDFLAKKEATETELAKELAMPISTVHYNLQNLVNAGLVKSEEFHYSAKGKEVNHYSLANKFIIIAPNATEGLSIKIRKILPVVLIVVAAAAVINFLPRMFPQNAVQQPLLAKSATMDAGVAESLGAPAVQSVAEVAPQLSFALWFLYGAIFSLGAFIIWDWIKERVVK